MKKYLYINVIIMTIILSSCGTVLNKNDPVSVARAFWTAALSNSPSEAKPFMVDGEKLAIGINGHSNQDTAILGKVDQQGGYYFIETTLRLERGGKVVALPLRTVVVLVNGDWRVDYWSTKQSVIDATFDSSMKWFASTISNADIYIVDILGAEDKEEALEYAEERLTNEFTRVKESILKNYRARLDRQVKNPSAVAQNIL